MKFSGSPVRESENSIEAVATTTRPKMVKNKNKPKKVKSILLTSGKEKYFSRLLNNILN